ncbi:YqeG family HAD IIIA-type phosphatase [Cyanobacteria bacterium FACHB-63]|nr:YqeG family HAD IIIA-type phosphatase [Cyanobacteria bacterium FACHB-63]
MSQSALDRRRIRRLGQRSDLGFPPQAETLAAIDIQSIISLGIRAIILDLDNTIISEDDRYLSPYAEAWIMQAKDLGLRFFILSNGKRRVRVKYWSSYLGIPAISPAKKPFPGAFRKAMKHMNVLPKQVVVIGDSRHTDVLGAWLSGCFSIQVASLPHPPRWWERLLGKYVQTPYPSAQMLWDSPLYYHHGNF